MIVWYPEDANIFDSSASVLVNPVNSVGVMGAGLALEFARRFPEIVEPYQKACRCRKLVAGSCLLVPARGRLIACLATKDDWKDPSRIEYVRHGMHDLVLKLSTMYKLPSRVAVPALGCGLGRLRWEEIQPVLVEACERRKEIVWELYMARRKDRK